MPAPGWGNIVTAPGFLFIHPDKIEKGLFLFIYFFPFTVLGPLVWTFFDKQSSKCVARCGRSPRMSGLRFPSF